MRCAVLFASKYYSVPKKLILAILTSPLFFSLLISFCFQRNSFVCLHVCKHVVTHVYYDRVYETEVRSCNLLPKTVTIRHSIGSKTFEKDHKARKVEPYEFYNDISMENISNTIKYTIYHKFYY